MLRRLRALAIDVSPLRRHREFRLLYTGQTVSFAGSMITYVAIPFQVYDLTRSTFVVGLLGIAQLAPLLVTALIGGALADAHDRRRLVLTADAIMLVLALALLANALLAEPQVWALFLIASGMAAAGGLQRPRSTRWCRGSSRARSCPRRRRWKGSAATPGRSPARRWAAS
jgi:MFS family permease